MSGERQKDERTEIAAEGVIAFSVSQQRLEGPEKGLWIRTQGVGPE